MKLQYTVPANVWTEALPIGNGRLGGMIFGGVHQERIQFNEDTFWSGPPVDGNNPKAKEVLPRIRELINDKNYKEADKLSKQMMGPYTQSYLPFGELHLTMEHGNSFHSYSRELNLEEGIAAVRYNVGSIQYTREYLTSFPDQIMAVRITASEPGALSLHVGLVSPLRYDTAYEQDVFIIKGFAPEHVSPSYCNTSNPVQYGDGEQTRAMRFDARVTASQDGGSMKTTHSGIQITGASTVTLYLSAATSFNGFDQMPNQSGRGEAVLAMQALSQAVVKGYDLIRAAHAEDYKPLFERVSLKLGNRVSPPDMSTDLRISEFGANDPELVELLFQYGRYLMISSSRPGTQPANLQGIWNEELRAPWSSNYTLNINAQMNYWPAENCNLSEMHTPFLDFIGNVAKNGKKTAETNYGAGGWVAHHNSDIWAQSAPVGGFGDGDPVWALWPMGGVWLTQHLWEHFAFGRDLEYLRTYSYPIMKEAAIFCLDWLHEDNDGKLITSPSTSPEQKFVFNGERFAVSKSATMDTSLIWELLTNCIEASELLTADDSFREKLMAARSRLYPMKIGAEGQLQEWYEDFEGEAPDHRHISHLVGVYPGRQLTQKGTPELFHAAKRSMELRGDGGTGWSLGWKVNMWARFKDGNRARALISNLLSLVKNDDPISFTKGGVYANMFDAHPPFQIDGNFAVTAGIAEMLVQSHQGYIELLPALPDSWAEGYVKGLRARGGFQIDICWRDGQWEEAQITSSGNEECVLYSDKAIAVYDAVSGNEVALHHNGDGLYRFPAEAGQTCLIKVN
ncbi:MAG: glycoside hydrolase family 95 protein [Bacillota bacterium]